MKILFLQNKGKNFAGVGQVNKLVSEYLVRDGYDVSIVSLRDTVTDNVLDYDKKIHVETLNTKDIWGSFTYREIISNLKKFKIKSFFTQLNHRLHNNYTMSQDKKKLQQYIREYNPDYIINTHYELLDMIPKEFLSKTYHEQHTSFDASFSHPKTRKTLLKYKDKISYIWLSKKTMEAAIKYGFTRSYYIYNAVRFETSSTADVIKNKKLVTITRISEEKRIDMMIDIVSKIFQNKKYHDWKLEIYGEGPELEKLKKKINCKQIKLMGVTNNPEKVLMSSSINLNTSAFEGFSLSILEANECGIPTVSFAFGESVDEEIINHKTGYIAKNQSDYLEKLEELMNDDKLLQQMSNNAKEFNKNFRIKNIIKIWEEILK